MQTERDKESSREAGQTLMILREAGQDQLTLNKGEEIQMIPGVEGTTPRTPEEAGVSLRKTEDTETKTRADLSQALNHDREDTPDTSPRMFPTQTNTVRDTENTHAAASALHHTEIVVQKVDTMCGGIMTEEKGPSDKVTALSECSDW